MASVVKKFCENFETGLLSSKFEVQTAQLKKAAIYFFATVGAFTVVNRVVQFFKPSLTRQNEKSLLNSRKPKDVWNTAFFFPDRYQYNPEMTDSSTSKLLHLLESAQLSIKVCMFLSSSSLIRKKIVQKFKEGLIIQVFMCHATAKRNSYRQVGAYTMEGIPVRMKRNYALMHNKFVVIDDEAVITGSLNWTKPGISKNHENVLVTTDPRIVSPYRKEFANLWNNDYISSRPK